MADKISGRLKRLALSYRADVDGRLIPEQLPAAIVLASEEGALYRRIAALADATNDAIAAAASRYGPLGPVRPVNVADRPLFLWAIEQYSLLTTQSIRLLGSWIASGGRTPIPGKYAPVAHLLAAHAEADPRLAARLLAALSEGAPPISAMERDALLAALDGHEHLVFAALSRRAPQLNADLAKGEKAVLVRPKPGTGRYLPTAARLVPLLIRKTAELGTAAELMPTDSIGRFATELRPYFEETDHNLYPAESVDEWRTAARELAQWSQKLPTIRSSTAAHRRQLEVTLTMRLQQVDAWPFPADEILGAFGRALWSLWPRITDSPVRRRCQWPGCLQLLPADAHGNRKHCPHHEPEANRQRAARNRRRAGSAAPSRSAMAGPN